MNILLFVLGECIQKLHHDFFTDKISVGVKLNMRLLMTITQKKEKLVNS